MTDILQIEPTRNCNKNCKTCSRDSSYSGDISIETFFKILDYHKSDHFDILKIQGLGEPFMHPDIVKLSEIGRTYGFKNIMTITNGSFPIVGEFDNVMFSINKLNESDYHDQRTINHILDTKKNGYNVRINCVLSDQTKDDINKVTGFADKYSIPIDIIPMEVWYGCEYKNYDELHNQAKNVYNRFNIKIKNRIDTCEWYINSLYYDYLGRLHPCCIRMTDEYIITDDEKFDFNSCCKNCPV